MSQENVEVVRKTIEARNRDLDEWLRFFDPNVETSDLLSVAGMPTETTASMNCGRPPRNGRRSSTIIERRSWSSWTKARWSSPRSAFTVRAGRAGRRRTHPDDSTASAKAGSSSSELATARASKPSKPPGCGRSRSRSSLLVQASGLARWQSSAWMGARFPVSSARGRRCDQPGRRQVDRRRGGRPCPRWRMRCHRRTRAPSRDIFGARFSFDTRSSSRKARLSGLSEASTPARTWRPRTSCLRNAVTAGCVQYRALCSRAGELRREPRVAACVRERVVAIGLQSYAAGGSSPTRCSCASSQPQRKHIARPSSSTRPSGVEHRHRLTA